MKTILIYKSNTGFTKKYVDSLERRLVDIEVVPFKKAKWGKLKNYDTIIYGGPLRANKIEGLSKLLKRYNKIKDKNIFIFATGIEPITDSKKEDVIMANGLEFYHVRFYILPGGMDYSKMSKLMQKLVVMGLKASAQKQNLNPDDVIARFKNPVDLTNMDYLDRMIDVYHKVKLDFESKTAKEEK